MLTCFFLQHACWLLSTWPLFPDEIRFDLDKDMTVGTTPERCGLSKFKHGEHFIYNPTISESECAQHNTMHVWIAKREGLVAESNWENTYLGEFPLRKFKGGTVLDDDFKFHYFPNDAGRQKHCCYLPRNVCQKPVQRVNPQDEDPDRPPLQTRKFEATAYCRFCGNSLCPSHVFSQKFQGFEIGELCQEHSNDLESCQQSIRLERGRGRGLLRLFAPTKLFLAWQMRPPSLQPTVT